MAAIRFHRTSECQWTQGCSCIYLLSPTPPPLLQSFSSTLPASTFMPCWSMPAPAAPGPVPPGEWTHQLGQPACATTTTTSSSSSSSSSSSFLSTPSRIKMPWKHSRCHHLPQKIRAGYSSKVTFSVGTSLRVTALVGTCHLLKRVFVTSLIFVVELNVLSSVHIFLTDEPRNVEFNTHILWIFMISLWNSVILAVTCITRNLPLYIPPKGSSQGVEDHLKLQVQKSCCQ